MMESVRGRGQSRPTFNGGRSQGRSLPEPPWPCPAANVTCRFELGGGGGGLISSRHERSFGPKWARETLSEPMLLLIERYAIQGRWESPCLLVNCRVLSPLAGARSFSRKVWWGKMI